MGISSSKSKSTPIYKKEVEGAYGDLSGAFNASMPKVQANADMISGLLPGEIERYQAGDAGVNAARDYVTGTLGRDPQSNPFLEDMIARTNRDVGNQTATSLGTRGLSGGSIAARIIADRLAGNETNLRYTDYNTEMDRKAQAAGMAPGLAAADTIRLAPIMAFSEAARAPLDLASQYAAGVGGLLGQYQKTKTTQPWGSQLLGAASNVAQAYAGGG